MGEFLTDQFSVPTQSAVATMLSAPRTENAGHLENIIRRLATKTEHSAIESMGSEHASYGSTRFHLKTLLPVDGVNHLAGIGDEAAAALTYYNPRTKTAAVVVYSSESHNGPSFVAPDPGAATGVGGVIRDDEAETATKPDAILDARRQADPRHNPHKDPVARHMRETTQGIANYGNAMGIPHGDGSIKFDPRYAGNNLVNVANITFGTPERLLRNKVEVPDPDKYVGIYVGKASDLTGIGGTKFASVGIDMTQVDLNEKAVQDPDPHCEEALFRGIEAVIDAAFQEGWADKIFVKDMGAAGLLCSSLEQLSGKVGVIIDGGLVPQNEPRTATQLLEAETQERMFIYVHEDYAQRVLEIINKDIGLPFVNKGARAAVIGRCNSSGRYTFVHNGVVEVDLPVEQFMQGPLLARAIREPDRPGTKELQLDITLEEALQAIIKGRNFKSDAPVHSHYDKHVRSHNIVERGEGAAALMLDANSEGKVGIGMVFDSNTTYGLLSPSFQAEDAIVRAAFRLSLMGCSPIGVSNNANYGRMNVPEEMWQFREGQAGLARACNHWQLEPEYLDMIKEHPAIAEKMAKDPRRTLTINSGNCSVNKANVNTGTAIPPTTIPLVLGWTNAPGQHATWDIKEEESTLYLIGERQAALGASELVYETRGPACLDGELPSINYATAQKQTAAVISAVRSGLVLAGNSIEEGGLANAVLEMVANTDKTVSVTMDPYQFMGDQRLTPVQRLFSESHGVVVQVAKDKEEAFKQCVAAQGASAYAVGSVTPAAQLSMTVEDRNPLIPDIAFVKQAYHTKLPVLVQAKEAA